MNNYVWKKNIFDQTLALVLVIIFIPFFFIIYIVVSLDVRSSGIFVQQRVGQYGKLFDIYKFKTLHPVTRNISKVGKFLRKSKIDELPQLFNILRGEMSFVGPRPDIEGYYDKLVGDDRKILQLKPGLTSEASLKYRNEEQLLLKQENPLLYNDEVLFPDKVKMNILYFERMSFKKDLYILYQTLLSR